MKIKISVDPKELKQAQKVVAALSPLIPGMRVKQSDKHPPFVQIYITGAGCPASKTE